MANGTSINHSIKRLIIKCAIMLLIFIGITQYLMYLRTGKTPFKDWEKPQLPDIKSAVPALDQKVYKWVDENGITQYSEEPPPNSATQSQTLHVNPNTNIVQGLGSRPQKSLEKPSSQVALPEGPIYSPDTIEEIMQKTHDVKKMLEERVEQQNKALENL